MNRQSLLAVGGALALAAAVAPSTGSASVRQATPTPPTVASEQARALETAHALRLDGREGLVVKTVTRDPDGATHVRYERTFNGLPVIGGDFVAHRDASGRVAWVSWNLGGAVAVPSTSPAVSAASALGAGARSAGRLQGPAASTSDLVVFVTAAGPRLAYDVVTQGVKPDQTPTRLHTVVDATSGATLQTWDDILGGSGNGIYVGTVAIGTTGSAGSYTMRDAAGNYATDLNQGTSRSGTTFTDADDLWGTGSTSSRQSAGVDAHCGAERTFDYYKNVLGRNGIWNNGVGARSRVHYGNSYVNAFWDGTQMTYGDGSSNTHPLTELDVAGHEMTHGVTENSANLVYSGESGGLNEATSDIFGTAVEWYANNAVDAPDYFIGETININGNGTPLRYLDKPSNDGNSADCWSSTLGGLNVHYSSGPLNHWYYLTSEGSGAKTINGVAYNSPTCNGGTVTGIGHLKAEKIWYRTLVTYLTSGSNYQAARNGAIRSAKDLYGAESAECAAVAGAFSAIAVVPGAETCAAAPPPGTNLLTNGGFEAGATSWAGTSGVITSSTSKPAHSGSWKAWLGGNGRRTTENVTQAVSIPATAASATLTFWVRIDTAETGSTVYDTLKVQIVSGTTTTLATYSNVGATATYAQKTLSLSAYKGKTVTLKLLASEDSSLQTSFVVDDVVASAG